MLFALWMVSSLAALVLLALTVFPGSHRALISMVLFWVLGVSPLSFMLWFRAARRREEEDVDRALEAWRLRKPGSGAALALALQEALDEEDEVSLTRLIRTLEGEPQFSGFVVAAQGWLKDNGGRASRDEQLEQVKELARPMLPVLSAR